MRAHSGEARARARGAAGPRPRGTGLVSRQMLPMPASLRWSSRNVFHRDRAIPDAARSDSAVGGLDERIGAEAVSRRVLRAISSGKHAQHAEAADVLGTRAARRRRSRASGTCGQWFVERVPSPGCANSQRPLMPRWGEQRDAAAEVVRNRNLPAPRLRERARPASCSPGSAASGAASGWRDTVVGARCDVRTCGEHAPHGLDFGKPGMARRAGRRRRPAGRWASDWPSRRPGGGPAPRHCAFFFPQQATPAAAHTFTAGDDMDDRARFEEFARRPPSSAIRAPWTSTRSTCPRSILKRINDDRTVADAVAANPHYRHGGDFAGAVPRVAGGSSTSAGARAGRLGVCSTRPECPSDVPEKVVGVIGGNTPPSCVVEGAEDRREEGRARQRTTSVTSEDTVVGIAASRRTPHVVAGCRRAASAASARCTSRTPREEFEIPVDVAICPLSGPKCSWARRA